MARFSVVPSPLASEFRSKWTAIVLLLDRLKLLFVLRFGIGVGAIANSVRTQRNDDVLCADCVCRSAFGGQNYYDGTT
jgi:hypothetical protein